MQSHLPEDLPFLCIPGVKEYHDHPGHSGDPWELHRPAGEGRLVRLLEVISKYGLEPVQGFHVNLVPQVTFAVSEPSSMTLKERSEVSNPGKRNTRNRGVDSVSRDKHGYELVRDLVG